MEEDVKIKESVYFDFQAESGLTKHIGGTKETDELVSLCHIEPSNSILDVGCGVGLTPIYLAKEHGVVVSGVDINTGMIDSACEYAKKDGVKEDTHFSLGDAQALPLSEGSFDAVICESVLVFLPIRERALEELIRVTKSGGYVGFTESIWRGNSKEKMEEFLRASADPQARMEKHETWVKILENSELIDTVAHDYDISFTEEA